MVNPDGNGQSKVRDLGLAAALVSSGHTIVATEHEDSGRGYFIFQENTSQLKEIMSKLFSNPFVIKTLQEFSDIKMTVLKAGFI